jgi:AraC family transcriptional regulator of adaptative response/methylated-DNA-[protein]-cysteine methyltransferase
MNHSLLDEATMYQALLNKDSNFEGLFFVGVKTTGIFCRPTCTARKPKKENVEFFSSTREALLNGYRPCKLCSPLGYQGEAPDWLKAVMNEVENQQDLRLKDSDLKKRGIDPNRVRRWFKKNHGMTFQAYLRTLRISQAFGRIKYGEKVIEAAYESGYESLSGFTESFKKTTGFSPIKSTQNQMIMITRILTPLGPMLAGATDEGICLLEFVDRRMLETQLNRLKKLFKAELIPGSNKHFDELNKQIKEYFEGTRKDFTVPLVLDGTAFQRQVWSALQRIFPIFQSRKRNINFYKS